MRIAVGILLAVGFLVAISLATLREASVSCEVCLRFGNQTECREGRGATEEDAIRGAKSAACAVLASGVTQAFACDRAPLVSAQCEE